MSNVKEITKFRRSYVAESGGWLEVRESDDQYNSFNERIVKAMQEEYGTVYVGNVNFYDQQREEVIAGTRSPIEKYDGEHLLNFSYSFVVYDKQDELADLIRTWNDSWKGDNTMKTLDAIMDLIETYGEHLFWS